MKKIRQSTWETNSSSTHAICIHKEETINLPRYIFFGLEDIDDYYLDTIQKRANYLHTIISMVCSRTEYCNLKAQINATLKHYNVATEWAKVKWLPDGSSSDYYEVKDTCATLIIKKIIPNDKLLLQYLFGTNSEIIIGYDDMFDERLQSEKQKHPEGEEYEYLYEIYESEC